MVQPLWKTIWGFCCCSVTQAGLTLQPHGLQHARPPCPSPPPRVCPSSHSLHHWCHPAITSSDALFSYCLQSFPASGTFPMSHLFTSDDQNTGASVSISPSSEYSGLISLKIDWFDLLAVCGIFRSFLQHHSSKASFLWHSAFLMVQLICDHWKDHSL